jgi:hypothetical protein
MQQFTTTDAISVAALTASVTYKCMIALRLFPFATHNADVEECLILGCDAVWLL